MNATPAVAGAISVETVQRLDTEEAFAGSQEVEVEVEVADTVAPTRGVDLVSALYLSHIIYLFLFSYTL